MRIHAKAALVATAMVGVSGAGYAAGSGHGGFVSLRDGAAVKWQPGPANLPKGTQISVIAGDPAKPGLFVLRVVFPADTVVAPHTHAQDETLTVIAGSVFHQHGERVDKAKGEELKTGGFVFLPKDMPHALWTTGEPVTLQVNGTGPFGVNYVNPADDPSKGKASN